MRAKNAYYFRDGAGTVWVAEDALTPRRLPPAGPQFVPTERAFVVGRGDQIGLVHQVLEDAKEAGTQVYVGGPCVWEECPPTTPEEALYHMRASQLPPAVGGFHPATSADRATYRAVVGWRSMRLSEGEQIQLLTGHPASCAVRFLDPVNILAAIRVLEWVVDPRWFIDPRHPDRNARMRSFMGLTPKVAAALTPKLATKMLERGDPMRVASRRCWTAAAVWNVPGRRSIAGRDFLRPTCPDTNDGAAVVKTSQRFIDYLRHSWLDSIVFTATGRPFQILLPEKCFPTNPAAQSAFFAFHRSLYPTQ